MFLLLYDSLCRTYLWLFLYLSIHLVIYLSIGPIHSSYLFVYALVRLHAIINWLSHPSIDIHSIATSPIFPLTPIHQLTCYSSIYPSIHLSIHPLHPSIYPSLHLSIHPFIIHPSIHPSIHPFIYPSSHSFIHPSIHSFIHPSFRLSIHSYIYPYKISYLHLFTNCLQIRKCLFHKATCNILNH